MRKSEEVGVDEVQDGLLETDASLAGLSSACGATSLVGSRNHSPRLTSTDLQRSKYKQVTTGSSHAKVQIQAGDQLDPPKVMAKKICISREAYERLKDLRREGETFTEVVLRVTTD